MKIYLAIKFHPDNSNRTLIDDITKHLNNLGHEVICAQRDFERWGKKVIEPKELLLKAFETIENSDLVLIEGSEKGMGVGIEAGYAFARDIPVITVARVGADISINLRSLSSKVISYSDLRDIIFD